MRSVEVLFGLVFVALAVLVGWIPLYERRWRREHGVSWDRTDQALAVVLGVCAAGLAVCGTVFILG